MGSRAQTLELGIARPVAYLCISSHNQQLFLVVMMCFNIAYLCISSHRQQLFLVFAQHFLIFFLREPFKYFFAKLFSKRGTLTFFFEKQIAKTGGTTNGSKRTKNGLTSAGNNVLGTKNACFLVKRNCRIWSMYLCGICFAPKESYKFWV